MVLLQGISYEVIDPIAVSLGIDPVRANRLQTFDGRLTGKVPGEIATLKEKRLPPDMGERKSYSTKSDDW